MFTMEELLSVQNQQDAFEYFSTRTNSISADGMSLSDFPDYWELNGKRILSELYAGQYVPGLVKPFEVLGKSGKKRTVFRLSSTDRFISRLLAQKLKNYMEPEFSCRSYAYQEGKSTLQAVQQAKEYIETGKHFTVEIDIENFFDAIPHSRLLNMLDEIITDKRVIRLIYRYLKARILQDNTIEEKTCGLLQGNAMSPVLSNFYLNGLDSYIEKKYDSWIRFADNINVYTDSREEGYAIFSDICQKLYYAFGLCINQKKSGIYSVFDRRLLGYDVLRKKKYVEIKKHDYRKVRISRSWSACIIEKVGGEYHIVQDGILNKKGYAMLFENQEEKHHIPVETTDQLNIYGNVTIASGVLNTAAGRGIRLGFFDSYGGLIGYFVPVKDHISVKTALKQYACFADKIQHLAVAKELEESMLHNLRANLRYYISRKHSGLEKWNDELTLWISKTNDARSIEELLLIEAKARQTYYLSFNIIMKNTDFTFRKRSRRPPEDELNTMISFGNTLLYNRFLRIIWKTSLDPRIGIIHTAERRQFNLNLDFADLFKPVITDRIIFSLVNRCRIRREEHFYMPDSGGIHLNKEGKQIFLEEFEAKLSQRLNIRGQEYSYLQWMEQEVLHYMKFITEKKPYHPFKYY